MAARRAQRHVRVPARRPPKGRGANGLNGGRSLGREPATVRITVMEEAEAMGNTLDKRAPATTYLTHYFGGGLIDKGECYVVERYRSMSSGEIRRWPGEAPSRRNGRGRPRPEVASVDEVRELRPLYNEIIVCTGLGSGGSSRALRCRRTSCRENRPLRGGNGGDW